MMDLAYGKPQRVLLDDNFKQSLRFAIGMFLFLMSIVMIQIFLGSTFTFMTLIPFTVIMIYFSYTDPFKGIMSYFCFLSVEGMYRYLSYFSFWEYFLIPGYALVIIGVLLGRGHLVMRHGGNNLPLVGLYLAALITGFIAIFNPMGSGIVGSTATYVIWYLIPMIMYPVVYFVRKKSGSAQLFCLILIVVGVFVASVQLLQYKQGKAWTEAHFTGIEKALDLAANYKDARGVEQKAFRPASTTSIGSGGGMWARFAVIAAFALFLMLEKRFFVRAILIGVALIGMSAVFLCGARVSIVFVVADIVSFSLFTASGFRALRKSIFLLLIGAVLVRLSFSLSESLTGGFVSERFESLFQDPLSAYQKNRQQALPNAIKTAVAYPFGIGYVKGMGTGGQFAGNDQNTGLGDRESQFGAYLADVGVPGLSLFTLLVLSMLYRGVRGVRRMRSTEEGMVACLGPSLLTGAVVVWFAASIMTGSAIYWMAMGMTFSLVDAEQAERLRRRRVWEVQKAPLALEPSTPSA